MYHFLKYSLHYISEKCFFLILDCYIPVKYPTIIYKTASHPKNATFVLSYKFLVVCCGLDLQI